MKKPLIFRSGFAALILISTIFLLPDSASASGLFAGNGEESQYSIPGIELRPQAGIAAYRSDSCACIDRYLWNASASLALCLGRFAALEADYRAGGIWVPGRGYVHLHGAGIGVRGFLVPQSGNWWSNLYYRAGYQRLWVDGTRQSAFNGGYIASGIEHGLPFLPDAIRMEHELHFTKVSGTLGHSIYGIRNGLVIRY